MNRTMSHEGGAVSCTANRCISKSMSPLPQNPFQMQRRTTSGQASTLVLPRHSLSIRKGGEDSISHALKQACVVIVVGTVLVSILAAAIPPVPPVPSNTLIEARRPAPTAASRVALGRAQAASLRSNRLPGGVRSQSRTTKKAKDNRPTLERQQQQQPRSRRNRWDKYLGQEEAHHLKPSSEEQSPSRLKLVKQVETTTRKQNAAANGFFGRSKDDEELVETNHDPILKANKKRKKKKKAKKKRQKTVIEVKDEKQITDESKNFGDVKVIAKKSRRKESDLTALISDSSEAEVVDDSKEEESKMSDKQKKRTRETYVIVDHASQNVGGGVTSQNDEADKGEAHVVSPVVADDLSSRSQAENVNMSPRDSKEKIGKSETPVKSADGAKDEILDSTSEKDDASKSNNKAGVSNKSADNEKDNGTPSEKMTLDEALGKRNRVIRVTL